MAKTDNRRVATREPPYGRRFLGKSGLFSMLIGELDHAIRHDQLLLYYQPQVSLSTGQVAYIEALVRWQHPQRGFLLPEQFIPMAEHTGLIKPLSLWVLGTSLRQCHVWQQAGLYVDIAVNLSMLNLQDVQLPDKIIELLAMWSIPPTRLEVEITESVLATDPERVKEILTRLSAIGVRIALDDFGIGYSSLASLKRLPVGAMKIDKSFVLDMAVNADDATIVRSIVDLGHNLGLKVVAEGVENQATWDLLAAFGCDYVQGYYLSYPLPAAALVRWLRGRMQTNVFHTT